MTKYDKLIGKTIKSNEGCSIEIVKKIDSKNVLIRFKDYDIEKVCNINNLDEGRVKNPMLKTIFGVGYFGVGKFKGRTLNREKSKEYNAWRNMLKRCYDEKNRHKYPTYKNVTVCDEWHNFQNFAEWYHENYPHHIDNVEFELDKDLLQYGIKNKIYSKDTCIFIPKDVNSFFTKTQKTNTSGYTCMSKMTSGKFKLRISEFKSKKRIDYGTLILEDDIAVFDNHMKNNIVHIKEYLRDLKYLDEDILSKLCCKVGGI